ncbi:hypothetical protein R5R35_005660 [Gryllus longicercus]|uniref:Uncharacterized protein n=1 Tax=Gryllus longicercus TaxID=2509291 RepID=A0AAN9VB31_9ORTH
MLIGSASRYIAGRGAVQTVYWRTTSEEQGGKMLKYGRVLTFAKGQPQAGLPARVTREVLSPSAKRTEARF